MQAERNLVELGATSLPCLLLFNNGLLHYLACGTENLHEPLDIPYDMISKGVHNGDLRSLMNQEQSTVRLFISGDRSSVGKTTFCLYLLASLIHMGVDPSEVAYIKPVTQCEEEQPIVKYCESMGIACQGIGPVVFYKGFTRAFLEGSTESSEELLHSVVEAVDRIQEGKKIVLIDGVGYPSVGSICGVSNCDVAKALRAPVLLVGKSGVGDAVDSFNLNAK
jgi:hypothetical protein